MESNKFQQLYEQLNDRQKRAVDTIDGPVMVVAGPGTGKTQILALRVANILRKTDVGPSAVLALTFTDAAAFNMRKRLIGFLGQSAYRVAIHTFHGLGVEIINKYPELFYGGASFLPADDATQIEMLEEIISGLDFDNPLRSEHSGKFVYLSRVKKGIEYLKKAGLTPVEFKSILTENKKALGYAEPVIRSALDARVSKKIMPDVLKAVPKIKKYKAAQLPGSFKPITEFLAESLAEAVGSAEESGGTRPLSEWKQSWTARDNDKKLRLVDSLNIDKMEALAGIYEHYVSAMRSAGYYDYNDMILNVIAALESNAGVRLDLQEKFQYILVDEFQDTNDAQMRLLRLLSDNSVHEGRPNIMVVGDDDQAVFKFQGAEITNIINFNKAYRDPALVVLKDNYRSAREVLDAARRVIKKGVRRLENIIDDIQKDLVAANRDVKRGQIYSKEFASRDIEYYWIAEEVRRLIKDGSKPSEIAVIAREHKELEALVPYLHTQKIPVSYERQQNVLTEPLVSQLITMARFVSLLMDKNEDGDHLLPEILSYPFWGLNRLDVWRLSVKAKSKGRPWLDAMIDGGGKVSEIAGFFIDLGRQAAYATAEEIIHELVGGPQHILPSDDADDEEAETRHEMFSPFRSYYFSKDKFNKDRAGYLKFLSSLQSFVRALREYKKGQPVSVKDMLVFVDTHLKNNLPVNNTSQFINLEESIHLMSAHKAKGLEFYTVFIINCQESVWANSRGTGLPLPKNLPISPAGDSTDDKIRLFYVALTRAKRRIYLTSYQTDDRGRASVRLGFIAGESGEGDNVFKAERVDIGDFEAPPEDILARQWQAVRYAPFVPDENALLIPLIERYQLSVTHLQNFLNIVDAGPFAFLEKNLLMFPQPKTARAAMGSAAHKTIQMIYGYLKTRNRLPTSEDVAAWFQKSLRDERLNEKDFDLMLKQGQKILAGFYRQKKYSFSKDDKIEQDFKNQGVTVGDALLAGKIDRMVFSGNDVSVHDFKTGRPIGRWQTVDQYEKIKAWKYKTQLMFYKLLVENSRDFGDKYKVSKGSIEFLEPYHGKIINLDLDITDEDTERLKLLVKAVYAKIKNLDFPDTADYSKDIKGIFKFEGDLLTF